MEKEKYLFLQKRHYMPLIAIDYLVENLKSNSHVAIEKVKSFFGIFSINRKTKTLSFSAPSEMRAREKESRYGRGGGGGDHGRRDRSRR